MRADLYTPASMLTYLQSRIEAGFLCGLCVCEMMIGRRHTPQWEETQAAGEENQEALTTTTNAHTQPVETPTRSRGRTESF